MELELGERERDQYSWRADWDPFSHSKELVLNLISTGKLGLLLSMGLQRVGTEEPWGYQKLGRQRILL